MNQYDTNSKEFKKKARQSKEINERLRWNTVYLFKSGLKISQIAFYLCLSENTVRQYLEDYDHEKTKNDPRGGSSEKLTHEQSQELQAHLNQTTYRTTFGVIDWMKKRWGVEYQVSGITSWLKQHGFTCFRKAIPTTGTQRRLHFIGGLNRTGERVQVLVQKDEKINTEAVIDFVKKLWNAVSNVPSGRVGPKKKACIKSLSRTPRSDD